MNARFALACLTLLAGCASVPAPARPAGEARADLLDSVVSMTVWARG